MDTPHLIDQSHLGPNWRTCVKQTLKPPTLRVLSAPSVAIAVVAYLCAGVLGLPPGAEDVALLVAFTALVASYSLIVGVHAGLSAYYGWRLDRGIQALLSGEHAKAYKLLRIIESPSIKPLDPHNRARLAWAFARYPRARAAALEAAHAGMDSG